MNTKQNLIIKFKYFKVNIKLKIKLIYNIKMTIMTK